MLRNKESRPAAFSPVGRWMGEAGGGTVWVRDLATNTPTDNAVEVPDGPTLPFTLSPDGRRVAVAGTDGGVRVWDRAGRREVLAVRGHAAPVGAVAFSPDGGLLLTAGDDGPERRTTLRGAGAVVLWDAATGRRLRTLLGHTEVVTSAAFSADGRRQRAGTARPGCGTRPPAGRSG